MTIKPLLDQYAAYDRWAQTRFVERLSREDDAVLDAPATSSFPSLRATLMHMRNAENTWRGRLIGEPTTWPAEASTDIATVLSHTQRFHDLVQSMQDDDLLRIMTYHDLRGNPHEQVAWQMIMHALNHNSYHRGQVVTQMRMLGLDEVPNTDLVAFQRTLPK